MFDAIIKKQHKCNQCTNFKCNCTNNITQEILKQIDRLCHCNSKDNIESQVRNLQGYRSQNSVDLFAHKPYRIVSLL